jgi:acyl-CoA oxidase
MTREELLNANLAKVPGIFNMLESANLEGGDLCTDLIPALQNPNPMDTHSTMFLDCLRTLATSKQREKWMPLVLQRKMIGTYIQTELGHGSNVQGLETLAVFDKSAKEFILSTPTLTSTKFWSGSTGVICTHGIVLASLISEGINYGVHPFLVHLRDFESHEPLKGIEVGDIGPKFGYNSMDNGYLTLHNVACQIL